MGYCVSAVLICCGLVLYDRKRTLAAPDILFCFEWGLISLFASFQLYGLYAISIKTWTIVLVGAICFLIGTSFANRLSVQRKPSGNHGSAFSNDSLFMTKRVFWVLVIVLYFFILKDFWQSFKLLQSGATLDQLRLASYGIIKIDGYTRTSGYIYETFSVFKAAIETITCAVGINYFITDMKANYKPFLAVIGIVLLRAFTDGGRFGLAYFVIELLVCFSLYKANRKGHGYSLSARSKRRIARIMVMLVATIVVVTLVRGADISELSQKYYIYLCGNMVFLDVHIHDLDASGFWSWSIAGFYGLWALVLPLLHNVFGIPYPQIYLDTIERVLNTQEFRNIGNGMGTNAFITPFYHLYADFRWLGVILGMLAFGVIAGYAYKKARYFPNRGNVFYLIIAQMIFKSLQFYPFVLENYVAVFIIFKVISIFRRKANMTYPVL